MTAPDQRRLEYLRLENLAFDPHNPRLPSRRSSDRTEVLTYLLESANLLDLMRSIGSQDFFPGEPLLVTEADAGIYTVVEGNRRYAACWLLSHPEDAPVKRRSVEAIAEDAEFHPSEVPCLVLPAKEIVGFLGYRHITGIQEWSPLAKARYLLQLWNDDDGPQYWDERLRWIAKRIGSKSDYVARLLTALALFERIEEANYYSIDDLNEETLSFSLLALAMNRPDIAQFIGLEDGQDFELSGLDADRLELLTRWFFEVDSTGSTRLGESRNVSMLVAAVKHPEALAALEAGAPLLRAYRLTQSPGVSLGTNLRQAEEGLEAVLATLRTGVAPGPADIEIAEHVHALSAEMHSVIVAPRA